MTDTAALPLPRPLPSTRHVVTGRDVREHGARGHQGEHGRLHGGVPAILAVAAVALVVTVVALAGWAGHLSSGDSGPTLSGPGAPSTGVVGGSAPDPDATGEAGGVVPDGTSAFDVDLPAVAGLDPLLLTALQRATSDAEDDGVTVVVNSGWRSAAYQGQLLDAAVAEYGTPEEAARWVATPATSAHVQGAAVDIGSWDATAWLSEYGAEYDLCQIYGNETWHYELRAGASAHGCPPLYRDPTQDPRMQR